MRNLAMQRMIGLGLTAALGLVGCGSSDDSTENVVQAPAFADGQGQAAAPELLYPAGPYAMTKGSIIANYKFIGYTNPADNKTLSVIQLADFYNPTGDGVYPEGSVFGAGNPKPKALLVDMSASWCPPCQDEAANELPGKYAKYKPLGGEFLLQLIQGPSGAPAKVKNLDKWTENFPVNYPSTIDPSNYLFTLFDPEGFPTNVIIDTRTMEVAMIFVSETQPSFWTKFQKVLDGE